MTTASATTKPRPTSSQARRSTQARRGVLAWLALGVLGGALVACGPPTLAIDGTFAVAHVTPHGFATDVSPEATIRVGFSEPVDRSTLDGVGLVRADGAALIDVQLASIQVTDNHTVSLFPRRYLEPDSRYIIVIPGTVASLAGAELGAELRSEFTTAED